MKVHLSAKAQADLASIGEWIAQDDPDAAVRFIAALKTKARQIGEMPFIFPVFIRRRGIDVRKRSYRRYLLLYTVTPSRVTVLRIIHGARDVAKLFRTS